MGAHQVRRGLAGIGELQRYFLGGEGWHVAVDAVVGENEAGSWGHGAGVVLRLMVTVHAALGKKFGAVDFIHVHIMAGGTVHLRHAETFAGSEQAVLIAMDVEGRHAVRVVGRDGIIIQRIPHLEAEGGPDLLSHP